MADEIIVNVNNTLDNIVLNNIINEEVITIKVSDNSDQVQIVSTPNLHQVNIIKGGGNGSVNYIGLIAPDGFIVNNSPITLGGNIILSFATGYSLPSDATQATWTAKQSALNGTGFVKITGTTISYDNSTYLTGITSGQVTTALGYTPYNATNPSGYISANQTITLSGDISGSGTTAINGTLTTISQASTGSFVKVTLDTKGRVIGNMAVGSSDITSALGYTPYNATNPNGYISGITSSQVNSALGYTPLKFLLRASYALMIADGTPTVNTLYTVTTDENKGYIRSTYLWKTDGNREWIASTSDN